MSQDARADEELATARRAQILNVEYYDTSQPGNKPLYPQILSVAELSRDRIVPIVANNSNITFGITNTTSQQEMNSLKQRFTDQVLHFVLISESGYREYMRLYNPPKPVVYHDISIKSAGSEDLVKQVSDTLEQVKADDMLA